MPISWWRRAWIFPLTFAGWVVSLFYCRDMVSSYHWKTQHLTARVYHVVPGNGLWRWMDNNGIGAFCWGETIITRIRPTPKLMAHEYMHTIQAYRWGILFPLLYVLEGWYRRWKGQDTYWDNAFEVEAREAEGAVE
jgi:hypothetical protein